uniref:Uncharacterized protein n=1 Tax=Arundo donax TaxID=35708 RepID=A0A0A9EHJ7_ARUDO
MVSERARRNDLGSLPFQILNLLISYPASYLARLLNFNQYCS